jgi:predicted aspartyl protease
MENKGRHLYNLKRGIMGLTFLKMEVANPGNPAVTESVDLLIDSGAIYSIVPKPVLERLGINPLTEQTFRLANGQVIRRHTGGALFKHQDRIGAAVVVFGEQEDSALLGSHTLAALGFALDPIRRVLVPLPMTLACIEASPASQLQ